MNGNPALLAIRNSNGLLNSQFIHNFDAFAPPSTPRPTQCFIMKRVVHCVESHREYSSQDVRFCAYRYMQKYTVEWWFSSTKLIGDFLVNPLYNALFFHHLKSMNVGTTRNCSMTFKW